MTMGFNTNNPLGSGDERDFYDNSANLDNALNSEAESWTDRLGVERPTVDYVLKQAGFTPAGFDFKTGGTLRAIDRNKCVFNQPDQTWYMWQGDLPKTVAANSTPNPLGDNGWKPINLKATEIQAREALRRSYAEAGLNMVAGSFQAGFTLVNANDVALDEATGKAFSGPAGTYPAGTSASGFIDRSSAIGMILYSDIRAYTGNSTHISCRGRLGTRDGGEGDFYLDLTDTVSPDDDGTVMIDGLGRRWFRSYTGKKQAAWYGCNSKSSDVGADILRAISGGGGVSLGDGQFNLLTEVSTDFTGNMFPVSGRKSNRYDMSGVSMSNTTFNTNGNTAFKHTGNSYTDPSQRGQGIYSDSLYSDFCIYGNNYTGRGFDFTGLINIMANRISFKKLDIGSLMKGVLVSTFKEHNYQFCRVGLVLDAAANSNINSVTFSEFKFGSCYNHAAYGVIGTRVTFSGGDVENCGWGENDVGGDDTTGGLKFDIIEPLSVLTISDFYFEGNEGLADIVINNTTRSPVIVNIKNTVFVRGNRRGKGCKFNIYPTSTGGGLVVLNFSGCYFFTQPNGGYTPTSSEPIIFPQQFVRVYGLDTCISSQRVNVAQDLVGGNSTVPMNVSSLGTKTMGPLWLSVVKSGNGTYRITSTYTLGVNTNQYSVSVTPVVTGFNATYSRISETSFDVNTRDSSGQLADCGFSLLIVTGAGEGR